MNFDFSSIDKIVEEQAELLIKEAEGLNVKVINSHKTGYFDAFQSLINRHPFWRGNPDTFKVAACLIAGLLSQKILCFDVNDSTPPDIFLINYRLAVNVALEFLSTTEIHTYTADKDGGYTVGQTHPTVRLSFPHGIIEAEEIYTSLCKSLAHGDLISDTISASSIAIILHLLYCYCKKDTKRRKI